MPLKYVIAFGFFIMGCSLLYSHRLVPDLDFWTLAKMRAFQTTGLAFMFVPISTITFATLPRSSNADGSALFTMSRNYFGSLSISAATALVQNRSQVHQAYLSDHTSRLDLGYVMTFRPGCNRICCGRAMLPPRRRRRRRNWLYQQLHTQAAVMAYSDVFLTTAILSFVLVPICLLASRKAVKGGGAPAAH